MLLWFHCSDRELAERNEKAEKLSYQVEQLENERAKLIQQVCHSQIFFSKHF